MFNASNDENNKNYIFSKEKRIDTRVPFDFDIYYPNINNDISSVDFNVTEPVLRTVNISTGGICFKNSIELKVGDFISFLLRINGNASFPCLAQVTWIGINDESYLTGCKFIKLDLHQLKQIEKLIEECENGSGI